MFHDTELVDKHYTDVRQSRQVIARAPVTITRLCAGGRRSWIRYVCRALRRQQ